MGAELLSGRYVTAEELAIKIGGGLKASSMRTLRLRGMPCVKVNNRYIYQPEAVFEWLAKKGDAASHGETAAQSSSGSKTAQTGTSSGTKMEQSIAKAQALKIAEQLRRR